MATSKNYIPRKLVLISFCILLVRNVVKGAHQKVPVAQLSKHPVLLVMSFDGFRWDYMSKTETPHLTALMQEGVKVPYMQVRNLFLTNLLFNKRHQILTVPIQRKLTANYLSNYTFLLGPVPNKDLSQSSFHCYGVIS